MQIKLTSRVVTSFCLGIASCVLLSSCANYKVSSGTKVQRPALSTEQTRNFQPLRINSIALVPLRSVEETEDLPPAVNEILISAFERKTSLEIINRTQVEKASEELRRLSKQAQAFRQTAAQFGQAVGAQGVLYGVVTHYNTSSGSKFGADTLASTGFKLWLIDPRTSQTLWSASYDNGEQPLSENLFRLGEKLKSGVGFRDADELLRVGFEAAAEELEKTREKTQ